ncbi:SRPBCC domain-containing protein [Tropicimonas sp.]|uniref:SRPBCC domain-containing protein n=1 Tax=Tropicimonas sp. TaxID=2067044 RepID=UPI003A859F0A
MSETDTAIRKTLKVPLEAPEAFHLFALRLAEWWPLASYSLSASEGKAATDLALDPRVGGRIVETRHDGNTADWGEITVWRPARNIGIDWYVGRDPDQASHVALSFTPGGAGCVIELVHSRFDRMGAAGAAAAANYDERWDFILGECFRRACDAQIAS